MKFLIIQTAFIGDVVLSTALIEDIIAEHPLAEVHFLLRKGNQNLLQGHPHIKKLYIWDKKRKFRSQFSIIKEIRQEKYDYILNLHRHLSSGIFTSLSGAKSKRGFRANPLSFNFDKKVPHEIKMGWHEVERNFLLVDDLVSKCLKRPKLYPSKEDKMKVAPYSLDSFYLIAPASVWPTKQWPNKRWNELIAALPQDKAVYLVGAPGDYHTCAEIASASGRDNVENLAGKFTLLQTAALMQSAIMNFTNDSAPLHLCSAMNAPVRGIFCSTDSVYGYTPLSENGRVVEVENLDCKPCGMHGHKACPKGHFRCAEDIQVTNLLT